jgi:hypothetical protein
MREHAAAKNTNNDDNDENRKRERENLKFMNETTKNRKL